MSGDEKMYMKKRKKETFPIFYAMLAIGLLRFIVRVHYIFTSQKFSKIFLKYFFYHRVRQLAKSETEIVNIRS